MARINVAGLLRENLMNSPWENNQVSVEDLTLHMQAVEDVSNSGQIVEHKKSTSVVEIVPVKMVKHDNADSLSVCKIFGGYTCVLRTEDWIGKEKAAYIPPDSLVDTGRPEFDFLKKDAKADGWARIKARKLRGINSYGLLVPVPNDTLVGEDWTEKLNVKHYEPEEEREAGLGGKSQNTKSPVHFSKYDIDTAMKYHYAFEEGEKVFCVEKVNGQNWRGTCKDGQIYVGSRNFWKADLPTCLFWKTLRSDPNIEKFIRDNPTCLLFGESYGNVGGFRYDLPAGEVKLAVFDIFDMSQGRWLDFEEARYLGRDLPWAPIVKVMHWNLEQAIKVAEFKTILGNGVHIAEGIVISPEKERYHPKAGRVKLKIVSSTYLEKS